VDTVALGGIFSPLAPWLTPTLSDALTQQALAARWSPVRVAVSRLGPDAAIRGAAGMVVQRILADPGALPGMQRSGPAGTGRTTP
jgi:hypothetical protein